MNKFTRLLLGLVCVGLLVLPIWAASPGGFNGKFRARGSSAGYGVQIDDVWGTKIKGLKVAALTFAPGLSTRTFVSTGTLPSSVPIVVLGTSLRSTSSTQYSVQPTTDTLTITLDKNAATTLTFYSSTYGI